MTDATSLFFCLLAPHIFAASRSSEEPSPPSDEDMRFRHLSDGIFVAPKFLSKGEVRYLRELLQRPDVGGWHPSETGGVAFASPKMSLGYIAAMRDDPIVRRIEMRIANVTAIPMHPDEDMFSFARIRDRATSNARGKQFPPFGLHHDTDTRPHRVKTVLAYLKAPDEGGRTIFPLLGAPKGQTHRTTGQILPELVERHQELVNALGGQFGGPPQWARQAATPGAESDHPLMDLLEAACRGEYGLSVAPKLGLAIMWAHMDEHGKYNSLMWHDGCNVVKGTKMILQKFKEQPSPERTFSGPSWVKYNPHIVAKAFRKPSNDADL